MRRNDLSVYSFSEGDEVLCVNNYSERNLIENEVYTCTGISIDNRWISLKEFPGKSFYANRFIPNTPLHRELL